MTIIRYLDVFAERHALHFLVGRCSCNSRATAETRASELPLSKRARKESRCIVAAASA